MNKIGFIRYILAPQQISEKFRKAEIVIVTDEQYPQTLKFELHNDKCDLLNGTFQNQKVNIAFDLRGKEYTAPDGKLSVFNTLLAWQITPV